MCVAGDLVAVEVLTAAKPFGGSYACAGRKFTVWDCVGLGALNGNVSF